MLNKTSNQIQNNVRKYSKTRSKNIGNLLAKGGSKNFKSLSKALELKSERR